MADINVKEVGTQAKQQATAAADKAKEQAKGAADAAKAQAKGAVDAAKAQAQGAIADAKGAVTGAIAGAKDATGKIKGLFKKKKDIKKPPEFKPKELVKAAKFKKPTLPNMPKIPNLPKPPDFSAVTSAVGGLASQANAKYTQGEYSNAKANPLGTLYNRAIKPQIEKGISLIGEKNKSLATEISNRLNTAENKISSIPDVKSVSTDIVNKIIS
jgi:hypothetical protein